MSTNATASMNSWKVSLGKSCWCETFGIIPDLFGQEATGRGTDKWKEEFPVPLRSSQAEGNRGEEK